MEEPLIFGLSAVALLGLSFLPLALLASDLFDVQGGLKTLAASLLSLPTLVLLLKTLGLAAAVTVTALVIGVPLGTLLGKTDILGGRGAFFLHAFPLFLPPFLLALGWFHLLGQGAPWGSPTSARLLFSSVGVIGTLGLAFSPVVTTLTALALRGVDPSYEEAARTVASPGRVVIRILWPLARPAIAFSALIVFALTLGEVGVPLFLRTRTYPAMVFSRLGGVIYAPGEAFSLLLPLFILALGLLALERRFIGRRAVSALGLRMHETLRFPLGQWRLGASVAVWIVALVSVLPILSLALRASPSAFFSLGASALSSVSHSLLSSLLAATLITGLGLILGHALARSRPASASLDGLAMLAFITPATLLGVGLVETWNRSLTQGIYTSVAILVVGFVARYAILGIRMIASVMVLTSPHYEEAAAVSGAGYLRRMTRVVAPMHVRAIIATWLLALVFCLRDLETVVIFYPPGLEPLTVRIFTLEANGPEAQVAALSILQVGVTAAILVMGVILLRKKERTS